MSVKNHTNSIETTFYILPYLSVSVMQSILLIDEKYKPVGRQ